MDVFQALFLGLLQGLTEFLPISSSAHLILTPAFFGWSDQGVGFDLSVHLGTLLAVVLYFRREVFGIARDGLVSVARRRIVGQGALAGYLVIGTIPAGLAGLALLDLIDSVLRSPSVIFATTLLFGLLLGIADWLPKRTRTLDTLSWKDALLVGIAQAMALVPGTSRSGVTITAGLFLGMTRETASRFSFLLSIPIIVLAGSVKLLEAATSDVAVDWSGFLIGGVTSFVMAITAIHFFLKWLDKVGMWPYVIYRIALAAVIYAVLM
ncbi:undecaprenyl-diphosphate phosphatase [Marinobacter lutaoensis]|jgi:undecaprenyl-diphosphatase|uniref:Undecaprenyl-diphosphatase n=1 Tax=Marinobacter lutaoensis TaxID=135739 RepID=A0A1V2DS55_9GAMM|nr:undecaprenyl-diphosphate phosphatase [Marinobacter lutaoensis]MBE03038.1 undecaprenyl-diphosphate phosphatase [Marinobacter sp.]NVD35871.1 undecaprenyl-diphosphate phosphatase [Marinobacter lutaoensis]ONF43554.1 undecaprenyl-diphosphatase [Marinobacter lutaoensis]